MEAVVGVCFDEADEHGDDFPQVFFAGECFTLFGRAFGDHNIQGSSAFQCRTPGDIEETAAVGLGKFPVSFSEVERY